jgi:hypothetical protein
MFVQSKRGSYIYLYAPYFGEEFGWELKKVKMREYGISKRDLTLMSVTPTYLQQGHVLGVEDFG